MSWSRRRRRSREKSRKAFSPSIQDCTGLGHIQIHTHTHNFCTRNCFQDNTLWTKVWLFIMLFVVPVRLPRRPLPASYLSTASLSHCQTVQRIVVRQSLSGVIQPSASIRRLATSFCPSSAQTYHWLPQSFQLSGGGVLLCVCVSHGDGLHRRDGEEVSIRAPDTRASGGTADGQPCESSSREKAIQSNWFPRPDLMESWIGLFGGGWFNVPH